MLYLLIEIGSEAVWLASSSISLLSSDVVVDIIVVTVGFAETGGRSVTVFVVVLACFVVVVFADVEVAVVVVVILLVDCL